MQNAKSNAPPRMRACSPRRVSLAVFFIVTIWGCETANGYRFLTLEDLPSAFPTVTPPNSWDPEAWGPESVLSFTLVDLEAWASLSGDIEEIREIVEEAMDAWESLPTADIRWKVGEVAPYDDDLEGNLVRAVEGDTSYTNIRFRRSEDGLWYRTEAWVSLATEHLADPYFFRYAMLHELGHVVGLDHASVYASYSRPANLREGLLAGDWKFDPVMSYGNTGTDRHREYSAMLTMDDRVGASLARPRSGWVPTTGNIRGRVLVAGGGEARLVHVLASRLNADGTLEGGIGAFTNAFGEFVIGGLEPGEYALLVRSLKVHRAHTDLGPWTATWVQDTLWASPVRVVERRRAQFVTLIVEPGHE